MQRLANGEWWTSLNSDNPLTSADGKDLRDHHTAHAQLVAIVPSESVVIQNDSASSSKAVSTLRSLTAQKPAVPKSKLLGPRRISCGTFLDYGPYTSFAPSWDQDGTEVGRRVLGEILWNSEEKRKRKIETTEFQVPMTVTSSEPDAVMDVDMKESPPQERNLKEEIDSSLEGLLPPDQIASFTSALGCLELECAVYELLKRNSNALQRLAELQRQRLSTENGGSSQAEEGSEEWDTGKSTTSPISSVGIPCSQLSITSSRNFEFPLSLGITATSIIGRQAGDRPPHSFTFRPSSAICDTSSRSHSRMARNHLLNADNRT